MILKKEKIVNGQTVQGAHPLDGLTVYPRSEIDMKRLDNNIGLHYDCFIFLYNSCEIGGCIVFVSRLNAFELSLAERKNASLVYALWCVVAPVIKWIAHLFDRCVGWNEERKAYLHEHRANEPDPTIGTVAENLGIELINVNNERVDDNLENVPNSAIETGTTGTGVQVKRVFDESDNESVENEDVLNASVIRTVAEDLEVELINVNNEIVDDNLKNVLNSATIETGITGTGVRVERVFDGSDNESVEVQMPEKKYAPGTFFYPGTRDVYPKNHTPWVREEEQTSLKDIWLDLASQKNEEWWKKDLNDGAIIQNLRMIKKFREECATTELWLQQKSENWQIRNMVDATSVLINERVDSQKGSERNVVVEFSRDVMGHVEVSKHTLRQSASVGVAYTTVPEKGLMYRENVSAEFQLGNGALVRGVFEGIFENDDSIETSSILSSILEEELHNAQSNQEDRIDLALQAACKRLQEVQNKKFTGVVFALLWGGRTWMVQMGSSRALAISRQGIIQPLTSSSNSLEPGLVTHPIITSNWFVEYPIIFLASEGVFEGLTNHEVGKGISELAMGGAGFEEIAETMVRVACNAGKREHLTAMVFRSV